MTKIEINKKTSEILVTVVAEKEVWLNAQKEAFKKLVNKLEIKGFRKGKIPADIAKKHISNMSKMEHAISDMLETLATEAAKEIKEDVLVLDSPTYKVDKISDTELEVTFVYPVYPEIKISDYKKLNTKFEQPEFKSSTIDEELKKIISSKSILKEKDGAIELGDTAIFDFDGSVDGEQFDGGKSENYTLEIGSGQFIPGFEDQMIGLKKGDTKDVKVTFPKEYHAKDLKGKEAIFKVLIHEVKIKTTPELNDAFVETLGAPGVKTVEELRVYIEKIFKEQDKQSARLNFQKKAFEEILEKTEIIVPAALIVKEMKNQENKFVESIKQQGLTLEKYIKMTGTTSEKLNSQFKQQAELKIKESLIFSEISKLEKIELTDADYEEEYKKLAKVYGQTEESIKGMITKSQMQIPMTNDKVIDFLIN